MKFYYSPPVWLRSGLVMTLYAALWMGDRHRWQRHSPDPDPTYQPHVFSGFEAVPIYGEVAHAGSARGTLICTYGITGSLEDQWILNLLGRKAVAQGYSVVRFDWRGHGKTAELSPTLTSDGLNEGKDFVHLAAQAKALGCPPPFWFVGYSLGGQLALWGIYEAQNYAASLGIADNIGGGAVICPSVESARSLTYLMAHPLGRYLERSITRALKTLAWNLHRHHPNDFDPAAIARAHSIWGFDQELVIGRLGIPTVEEYYALSSPLRILPQIQKPTLILYAVDDPMFDPTLVPDLDSACAENSAIDLVLTPHGGHVGYVSSASCQQHYGDPDPWWAINRILDWVGMIDGDATRRV
ncbi:MAG: alpha/beta fold hydrolase [Kaiparowitsia implicata GSE-PSE-MK54-09C]|jgi:predicted alpha/beta-fold hydrolase|nr:alpha/beta fold hydrolase [Kaiparowitsia implicata GSE-PSE-MK54-09C]